MMKTIKYITAGESHGQLLMGIIEGIPSNLDLDTKYIHQNLLRRQKGFGRSKRMQIESDIPELYTGVRFGKTLGSPIGIIIKNKDWKNWENKMSISQINKTNKDVTIPRPGHADLAGVIKYNFDDIRNVIERSSARETTMRVALGSVCKCLLEKCNIYIGSYVKSIYNISDDKDYTNQYKTKKINMIADKSPVRSLNKSIENKMIKAIKEAQSKGDSVGGEFRLIINGLPYGLGSYTQWNKKLNSSLSEAICSINAIKGVSFGLGNKSTSTLGSSMHDEIYFKNNKFIRSQNNAGGIEGGMSNAQPLIITASMKPLSTLTKPLQSVDIKTHKKKLAHKERTDSCAVPSASIISESMAALVVADELLYKFGGDSMHELLQHMQLSAKY